MKEKRTRKRDASKKVKISTLRILLIEHRPEMRDELSRFLKDVFGIITNDVNSLYEMERLLKQRNFSFDGIIAHDSTFKGDMFVGWGIKHLDLLKDKTVLVYTGDIERIIYYKKRNLPFIFIERPIYKDFLYIMEDEIVKMLRRKNVP